jgi:putative phosphoesterase
MRIGLISDTHIPQAASKLPEVVFKVFTSVDLILHAGDIYNKSVLDDLEDLAPVLAAEGDDDYPDTIRDKRVKEKHVLQVEGKTIWLIHENPFSSFTMISQPQSWENYTMQKWSKITKPDVIVFGHEHRTHTETVDDILMISPGSPTFLHYKKGLGTLGILDISPDKIDYQIINLSDK